MMSAHLFRGISFSEAAWTMWSTVAYVNEDTRKDYGERRFNLVGLSKKGRALHITFSKRVNGEIIRIISVRRANKRERTKLQEKFPEAIIQ
ncbi:MAG: BrnT family toxin [Bdellovibrionales bacterium]|nr:BrnT family toxin [Bdellovibrionales bacterium]